ncbi:DUF4242 domain-containing protein [Colwellia sp. 1_MG-2023]|uniref:DUF4242 domain-containing protein n=1 Tax=Colwellia sp. 1_MG-2023 TaxID=3062649 RepID=UPI0026E2C6A1|nr:DUF4242 domain-containing protein [Colwellia sp. 1_MG-2023]MDO6447378.1 DUF4242 domain-containing protein [Colwellia sp. 1_MG-2023]
MALFLIERSFAEQVEMNKEAVEGITRINDDNDIRWLQSFLSSDKKKTYCLYEAESADAIKNASKALNIPCDTIVELGDTLTPEAFV